jgi:hypothetical protein
MSFVWSGSRSKSTCTTTNKSWPTSVTAVTTRSPNLTPVPLFATPTTLLYSCVPWRSLLARRPLVAPTTPRRLPPLGDIPSRPRRVGLERERKGGRGTETERGAWCTPLAMGHSEDTPLLLRWPLPSTRKERGIEGHIVAPGGLLSPPPRLCTRLWCPLSRPHAHR